WWCESGIRGSGLGISPLIPLDVEAILANVQAERAAAEGRDVLDLAADAHVLAGRRGAKALRNDGHLTGPVIDLVHFERYERHAPRLCHDATDADRPVLVASRMALEVDNIGVAQRQGARGHRRGETDDGDESREFVCHTAPRSKNNGPRRLG